MSFVLDIAIRQFSVVGSPQTIAYTKEDSMNGMTFQGHVRFYPK